MWWPFNRRRQQPSLAETAAALPALDPTPAEEVASDAEEPFALDVALLSDRGCHRETNEDRGRCVRPGDAATRHRKGVLVLVADGMGGHAAGEVASTAAAEVIARRYYAAEAPPPAALRAAFVEANRAIHTQAQADADLGGMGTTCTALVLRGHEAWAAHVGDSRLYRLRNGRFERLTEDHSVVSELVSRGMLTEAQARNHEARNVITRALGIRAEVEPAVRERPLDVAPGDVFVLTSDGLYDLVDDDEIARAVGEADAHAAADALVALAKARGGYDNVTVGVVRVRAEEAGGAEAPEEKATREAPALS